MNVFPDFDGLAGISELREVAGALLMFVLVVAVLMLIVSAICWAIGAANGNYQVCLLYTSDAADDAPRV